MVKRAGDVQDCRRRAGEGRSRGRGKANSSETFPKNGFDNFDRSPLWRMLEASHVSTSVFDQGKMKSDSHEGHASRRFGGGAVEAAGLASFRAGRRHYACRGLSPGAADPSEQRAGTGDPDLAAETVDDLLGRLRCRSLPLRRPICITRC